MAASGGVEASSEESEVSNEHQSSSSGKEQITSVKVEAMSDDEIKKAMAKMTPR